MIRILIVISKRLKSQQLCGNEDDTLAHIFLFLVSQMTQAQLETLQTDNHHLRALLHKLESPSSKVWHSCDVVTTWFYTLQQTGFFLHLASVLVSKSDSFVHLYFVLPESLHAAQKGGSSLASLQENYVTSLSGLEQENRQLKQALSEMHARVGYPNQDNHERARYNPTVPTQPQPALDRYSICGATQSAKHQEPEAWCTLFILSVGTKISCRRSRGFSNSSRPHPSLPAPSSPAARLKTADLFPQHPPRPPPAVDTWGGTQYHPRVQMNLVVRDKAPDLKTLWSLCPETKLPPVPLHWWDLSQINIQSPQWCTGSNTLPSFKQTILQLCVFLPLQPLSVSPADGMVTRFLEDEMLRNEELLQRLDTHIQDMKEGNIRTVSKYLPSGSGPDSAQTSVPNGQWSRKKE